MPRADDAKIKSAPNSIAATTVSRKKYILYGLGGLAALFLVLAPFIFYSPPQAELRVSGHKVTLEIARTAAAESQGLGGRSGMTDNEGMLFVLEKPATACFWMKDMRFSLDIIWLNSAKQVVHVQPDVSPKTFPKTFCSDTPAKYVIELNAGQAQGLGIGVRQTLAF